jgi:hypothetical protein
VAVSTNETPLVIWGSGTAVSKAHLRQDVVLHAAATMEPLGDGAA